MLEGNGMMSFAALYALAREVEPVPWRAALAALAYRFRETLAIKRTFILELGLVLYALLMGVWLLVPGWEPLNRPGAFVLTGRVPEWLWGLAFLGNGVHWLFGLVMAFGWKKSWGVYHCFFEAVVACLLWGTFFLDFFAYSRETLGVPLFLPPWLLSLLVAWRLPVVIEYSVKRRRRLQGG